MGQEYELPGCEGLIPIQFWHWQPLLLCYEQETQKMTIKACQINANTEPLTAAFPDFLLLLVWIAGSSNSSWKTDKQQHHIVASKNVSHIFDLRGLQHFQLAALSSKANDLSNRDAARFLWKTKPKKTPTSLKEEKFLTAEAAHGQLCHYSKKVFSHDCSKLW